MDKKTLYSDEDLEEFRGIINDKLKVAHEEYSSTMRQLMNKDDNGVDDTSPTYNKVLDDGNANQSKEDMIQMVQRLQKFIIGLEAALLRIENKTYGVDLGGGGIIKKKSLRVVPHATLSVASKNARKK